MVSAQHLPLQISQSVCPHIHSGPTLGVKGTCVRTMKEHKCDLYAMCSSLAVAQHGFSPKPDTHFSSTDGQETAKDSETDCSGFMDEIQPVKEIPLL